MCTECRPGAAGDNDNRPRGSHQRGQRHRWRDFPGDADGSRGPAGPGACVDLPQTQDVCPACLFLLCFLERCGFGTVHSGWGVSASAMKGVMTNKLNDLMHIQRIFPLGRWRKFRLRASNTTSLFPTETEATPPSHICSQCELCPCWLKITPELEHCDGGRTSVLSCVCVGGRS